MAQDEVVILCPGQGAQAIGMGQAWADASGAARDVFAEADEVLVDQLGTPLSQLCFNGPADRLNQTDVSQPAIYTCSVACYHGMVEREGEWPLKAVAGLSLGEYTALHLAGVFSFADGLRLVATRGRAMQNACDETESSMVALIGADEGQADDLCSEAAEGQILVPANYNAPGQIVLSGHIEACRRASEIAGNMGLRASMLTVAGAFHSPLMQSAADTMQAALKATDLAPPQVPVWSNVTAEPHDQENLELLRQRLVEQIIKPVKWAQTCLGLVDSHSTADFHELGPGTVLRGLMRRIDRNTKVTNHDAP